MYNCDCFSCHPKNQNRIFIKLKGDRQGYKWIPGCVDFYTNEEGTTYFQDINGMTIMVITIDSVEDLRMEEA